MSFFLLIYQKVLVNFGYAQLSNLCCIYTDKVKPHILIYIFSNMSH